MRSQAVIAALLCLFVGIAGCDEKARQETPAPLEVSDAAIGYYCGMSLPEHAGPKGQIFIASRKDPVWFSSVRDTIAFTLLPEEPKDIAAIYVNDMAKATSWDQPEPGAWVLARDAWYVLDSGRKGGMGGNELVPFGSESAARAFVAKEGGRVVRFAEIPRDYILAEGPAPALRDGSAAPEGHSSDPADAAGGHGHK